MRTLSRIVVNTLVTVAVMALFAAALPGFRILSVLAAVLGVAVIGLLNAFVRPILVRVTLPLTLVSLGFFSLLLNGALVRAVTWFVPGFIVSDILTGVIISFGLTLSHTLVSNSLLFRTDRALDEYQVIQRFARRRPQTETRTPGLILLEIDGLAEPILRAAIHQGHMPTLAQWLKSGRYTLTGWESGLPAQTSAMQAGILHGSHYNIPAFRFYNKREKRLLVSNYPRDAQDMIQPLLNGAGVLKERGFSLNNWASGDADDTVLTFTTLAESGFRAITRAGSLYSYFANTFLFQQALVGMVWDMVVEWREARYQRVHNVLPRVDRKFPYPIVRAITTVLMPQLSGYVLISKMFEGVAAAYTTFVSYDEVAHHSGIDRPDALRILEQLDHQIGWITQASQYTPRPYEVVILSDHGQSQGATFRQRYGQTLADLVNSLLSEDYAAPQLDRQDEGMDAFNLLLSQLTQDESRKARMLRRALLRRTVGGYVQLGTRHGGEAVEHAKTVVCASGNLAHIYFTEWPERLSLEDIYARFPGFVDGLVNHPGIGFVLAYSEVDGAVALGKSGAYYIDKGEVEGEHPLRDFGPHAANHLKELSVYPNVGDLVVNSLYDPLTGEVAAFEELVGSHGGLGGLQNRPFLLYPTHLQSEPLGEIIGAPAVYTLLRRWQAQLELNRQSDPTI